MKKYVAIISLITSLFLTPLFFLSADVTIDKFVFSDKNKFTVGNNSILFDMVADKSTSNVFTSGQYGIGALIGFYGSQEDLEKIFDSGDYDEKNDNGYSYLIRVKGRAGLPDKGILGIDSSISSSPAGNYLISTAKLDSNKGDYSAFYVDPGKYELELVINDKVVMTKSVCLPTIYSTTVKAIGNETCGNAPQNQNNNVPPVSGGTPGTPANNGSLVLDKKLSVVQPVGGAPVVPVVDITPMKTSVISGTTAQFEFQVTAVKNTSIDLTIQINDSNGERVINESLYSNSILIANSPALIKTRVFNFSQYGTYTFQIFDSTNTIYYQKTNFTLQGAPVPTSQIPFITDAKSVVAPLTTGTAPSVTITGNLSAQKLIKDAQLYVFLGTESGNLSQMGPLFGADKPRVDIPQLEPVTYNYKFTNLNTGTTYYYEIKDLGIGVGGKRLTPPGASFTTPGTKTTNPIVPQGQSGYVFNPDDPGLFGDYNFPTNIGEPVGPIGTDVIVTDDEGLVPCGKRSDIGTLDENCDFDHFILLIGRIIDYLLILLVPLTVFVTIYTGVQMIIHRGVPAELMKYKENLKRIGIGVAIMLLAWTIVGTIMQAVVDPAKMGSFLLLDILG